MTLLLTSRPGSNSKLGPGVGSYSVPVGVTCPGASEWCRDACYASRGLMLFPANVRKYADNLAAQMLPEWEQRIVAEIRVSNVRDFRIHVGGDIASPVMARKWVRVVRQLRGVNFWLYTRSWRVGGKMLEALEELRAEPNVSMYASVDDSIHDEPPAGWLTARSGDIVQLDGGVLCPAQTSKDGHVTCSSCRHCIEGRGSVVFVRH